MVRLRTTIPNSLVENRRLTKSSEENSKGVENLLNSKETPTQYFGKGAAQAPSLGPELRSILK